MKYKFLDDSKNVMILVIGIIIYGIVISIIFFNLDSKDNTIDNHYYVFLDGENFYEYDNDIIKTISFNDTDFDKTLFQVYEDYKYSGDFYISKNSSEFQSIKFTKNKNLSNSFIPKFPFIALTKNINYIEFEKQELTSSDMVHCEDLLRSEGIDDDSEDFYQSYKITLDIDNDFEDENIFVVSNYDYINIKKYMFSIIYIDDDNELKILEENIYTPNNYKDFVKSDISYVLDLKNDGMYTLVVSNSDKMGTINNFYIKNNNYYKNMRLA